MSMEILVVEERDIPEIAQIENESFPNPWKSDQLLEESGNPAAVFIKTIENKMIAGYCIAWLAADEMQLVKIAVRPHYRRKGYGTQMLNAITRTAKERKCGKIHLEVRSGNQEAIQFYHGHFFKKSGRRKSYFKTLNEDAVLMTKTLFLS